MIKLKDLKMYPFYHVFSQLLSVSKNLTQIILFSSQGLLACLGGKILCAIASRILKDHRHTRAGMPDLTMWSTTSNKYKV